MRRNDVLIIALIVGLAIMGCWAIAAVDRADRDETRAILAQGDRT